MNSQIRSQSLALLVGALNTAPLTGGCTADDSTSSDAGDPASSAKKASDALWTTYWATTMPTSSTCNWPGSRRFGRTLDDAELTALLAATHWWHLSEAAARERHPDPAVLNSDLLTALQLMRQAAQLNPDEDHWPGFIGVLTVHIGPRTNDLNLVAQGAPNLLSWENTLVWRAYFRLAQSPLFGVLGG